MSASLEVPDLVRVLKGVDPAVFLVSARVLRRVIKQDRQIGGFGLFVPHRKSYVIAREPLLHIVDCKELGVASAHELPNKLILLAAPEPDRLARLTREQALVKYWRMLFHARLDLVMEQKIADGTLKEEIVRQRIERLGTTEFDEIAFVMRQENYLLPPDRPQMVYAEFVAVYLTLRRFAPRLLPTFFPALGELSVVDEIIAEDIDGDALYRATRLPGAPEPDILPPRVTQSDGLKSPVSEKTDDVAPNIGNNTQRRLEAMADAMDAKGNNVRAAILRTRSAQGTNQTLARARGELAHLTERLQKALELSDAEAERWRNALLPLLPRSARRWWSQEARFLYDLQKVCVDSERGIFAVDLVEWALSLGRRPIRRPLPRHQEVVVVRHLRKAAGRMRYLRIANGERQELIDLLQHAVEQRERLLRERFRPIITGSLEEVGLKPHNVPEELGRAKLTEELLDRVVEYGHFNIGNLRDTISRNQLKLPDLKSPVELVAGDPFIRLNRKLAVELDGVYRRGEIYMRLLHRLSSVAFGTVLGRLLVMFLILPLGLAFFVMVTPGLLVEEGEKVAQWIGVMEKPPVEHKGKKQDAEHPPDDTGQETEQVAAKDGTQPKRSGGGSGRHAFPMPNLYGVAGFGVFFLLLFHVATFRSGVFYGVGRVGRGLQTVLIHGPMWLFKMPVLQAILHNRYLLFLRRFLIWPVVMAVVAGFVAWAYEWETRQIAALSFSFFVLTELIIVTRLGRDLEETLTDWLAQLWLWCTTDFVPGFLRLIMDMSRWCLEAVEQVLYTVNEWLRFRGGDNRVIIGVKAILALFWFWVMYVIRFAINLLIEPQINPIKHFPVVTVSHKVCLPMIPVLRRFFIDHFGMVHANATGLATGIIFGIPGIFGFAVWELKENWKLYNSNRSRYLKPVRIGSHGETMLRLLKPGFHSGTVPKLYRKLRRAIRHGDQRSARKIQAALHHVEESIRYFVERELLALLRQSKGWGALPIEVGKIHLATNRIAIELHCPMLDEDPLEFVFDHQSGWLVAGVLHSGWLPKLSPEQRQTLTLAVVGFYKMAGVELTREQISAGLAPTPVVFDINDDGLVVWAGNDFRKEAIYDLTAGPVMEPRPTNGALPPGMLRPLDAERVLFSNLPLSWNDWTGTWDRDKSQANGERREWAYAVLP